MSGLWEAVLRRRQVKGRPHDGARTDSRTPPSFFFHHVPKTGGTSFVDAMRSLIPDELQASENGDLPAPFVRELVRKGLRPGQFIYGHPGPAAAAALGGAAFMTVMLREPREHAISNYLSVLGDWRTPDHALAKALDFRSFLQQRPYFAIFQTASLYVGLEERPTAGPEDFVDRLPGLLDHLAQFGLVGTTETASIFYGRACQILRLHDPPALPHHLRGRSSAEQRQHMREQYEELRSDPVLGPLIAAEAELYRAARALEGSARMKALDLARPAAPPRTFAPAPHPEAGKPLRSTGRNVSTPPDRGAESAASVEDLLALTDPQSHPNINALWRQTKDIEAIKLDIKFFGYELAQRLVEALPRRQGLQPFVAGLASKACTQQDMETDWLAYWCGELKQPLAFNRKLWEFAYVLQALYEGGKLEAGARGVGFGCGDEPIASLLASKGVKVTVSDLPRPNAGEAEDRLLRAHRPDLLDLTTFKENAGFEAVDMNDIPPSLAGHDFCWSISALQHLGSIEKGMDFVERSLSTLKPGGLAVHTTEFNYLNDHETVDHWPTVLFQRRHFQELRDRLRDQGHNVAPLDFQIGSKPMDAFIDLPPFVDDWPEPARLEWGPHANHLKACIDGFACTCFGLIVGKSEAAGASRPQ